MYIEGTQLAVLAQDVNSELMPGQDSTYHRNSLDEFLEERRLSSFHFLLPFLSGLMFSSSHLSNGEPTVTGESNKIFKNKKVTKSQNRLD